MRACSLIGESARLIAVSVPFLAALACGRTAAQGNGNEGSGGSSGDQSGGSSSAGAAGGGAPAAGGTGGGGVTEIPGTGTLGDACETVGELACAGRFQKLGIVCGASGTWEANLTCSGDQFCDTNAGSTRGTCRTQAAECAGEEPGFRLCDGWSVRECGPDTLDAPIVAQCPQGCQDGVCGIIPDSCSGVDVDCSGDTCNDELSSLCLGPTAECTGYWGIEEPFFEELPLVVRAPSAASACSHADSAACDARYFMVHLPPSGPTYRVTVGPDFGLFLHDFTSSEVLPDLCGLELQTGCLIVPPATKTFHAAVLVAKGPGAPERNVLIEEVSAGTTCSD